MEEGQFSCMRTKRKYSSVMTSNNLITSSPTNKNYEEPSSILSWEEQAFAEDAALLGGCIWPPRSYSCSFCRREFRSAQALGGHMNVHRRDRARLKQQPPSSPHHQNHDDQVLFNKELETTHQVHNHSAQNPFTSLGYNNLYPSHIPVCGSAYIKINPNSDPAHEHLASPSSSSLLPSPNSKETLIPLHDSSSINLLHGLHKTNSPLYCSSKLWSNLAEDRNIQKISKGSLDSGGCRGKDKTHDVAVSLNLFRCRAQEADISNCNKKKKKKKTHDASSIPIFFPKSSSSVDHRHSHHHMQSQMFEYSPSSIEEIDLELRLGNRSKSKGPAGCDDNNNTATIDKACRLPPFLDRWANSGFVLNN